MRENRQQNEGKLFQDIFCFSSKKGKNTEEDIYRLFLLEFAIVDLLPSLILSGHFYFSFGSTFSFSLTKKKLKYFLLCPDLVLAYAVCEKKMLKWRNHFKGNRKNDWIGDFLAIKIRLYLWIIVFLETKHFLKKKLQLNNIYFYNLVSISKIKLRLN